jgi:transposase
MVKVLRKGYTTEFKEEAVRLVEAGQSLSEVARQLGLSKQTLFNWCGSSGLRGQKKKPAKEVTVEEMDLSRLRAEVNRLKMENEILKKAAAYFAKEMK